MKKSKIISIQLFLGLWFSTVPLSLSQAADVTLTVGDGSGSPGSSGNAVGVSLDNSVKVRGIQVNVCDVDNYLACTGCDTTGRTSAFSYSLNELDNGCCTVALFVIGTDLIEVGTGPIFTIKYDVSGEAPGDECRDLDPEEVKVLDEDGEIPSENVTAESGGFCFSASTTTTTTPSIGVSPDPMWKSRWISLPYLMVIAGNNTHFKCFNSRLSFEPPLMVFPCFPIVWDEIYIWNFIWVMPGWLAGLEDQTVTVTITTGEETVEDDFEVKLLPFILNQERSLR